MQFKNSFQTECSYAQPEIRGKCTGDSSLLFRRLFYYHNRPKVQTSELAVALGASYLFQDVGAWELNGWI